MKNFPLAVAYAPTSLGNALGGIPDLLLSTGLPPMRPALDDACAA